MAQRPQHVSRGARTARGAIGAAVATLLAAASHALAGGEVSAISVLVTALVALPLCVALAGRIGSVWRIGVAVSASQFLYHWAFAGIGSTRYLVEGSNGGLFEGAHAAHLSSIESFVPMVLEAGAADAFMWVMHALAAFVSAALISRGEQAFFTLCRAIWHALPQPIVRHWVERPRAILELVARPSLRPQLLARASRPLRGPPAAA